METFFCVTDPLWGESNGHRWISLIKPVTKLWCFLCSAPEQTAEQTIETSVPTDITDCNEDRGPPGWYMPYYASFRFASQTRAMTPSSLSWSICIRITLPSRRETHSVSLCSLISSANPDSWLLLSIVSRKVSRIPSKRTVLSMNMLMWSASFTELRYDCHVICYKE